MIILVILFGLMSFLAIGAPMICKKAAVSGGGFIVAEQSIGKIDRILALNHTRSPLSLVAGKYLFADLLRALQSAEKYLAKSFKALNNTVRVSKAVILAGDTTRIETQECRSYMDWAKKRFGEAIECIFTIIQHCHRNPSP